MSTAVSRPVSGGSKVPSRRWMSVMARPMFSAGTSSRKLYQGSSSWLLPYHQPLAHRTVGGLAEISAFGVFQVGFAGNKGDLHIGEGAPVSTPRCCFSSKWVSTSRCQFLSSTSSRQSAAYCIPLPGGEASVSDAPQHNGAEAHSCPTPSMGSVMGSLYNIPPGPKDTSSPKRWASRVRSTSSWISPISCK